MKKILTVTAAAMLASTPFHIASATQFSQDPEAEVPAEEDEAQPVDEDGQPVEDQGADQPSDEAAPLETEPEA